MSYANQDECKEVSDGHGNNEDSKQEEMFTDCIHCCTYPCVSDDHKPLFLTMTICQSYGNTKINKELRFKMYGEAIKF